jgi:hypothetical protein
MKVLFVSFRFPPYNSIGAVRTGKTAKYLEKFGYEVHVLTAENQELEGNLKTEITKKSITRTSWFNVNMPLRKILFNKYNITRDLSERKEKHRNKAMFLSYCANLYKNIFHFPDAQIGWYPYAVTRGKEIIRRNNFDIIYASAGPYTSFLIAATLSKSAGIPWVAEFRDLWIDHHNRQFGPIRNSLEGILERKTIATASGLVTVSQPLADILKAKYSQPTAVITNGFDPNDYKSEFTPAPGCCMRLVYTGSVFQGKQDPSPLFEAIGKLGEESANLHVDFYGDRLSFVKDMAEKFDCSYNVSVHSRVSYEESLKNQQTADILLFLLWNDPDEKGIFSGKLFEYLGARRPVLAIGPVENVASQAIIERKAGIVLNDPEEIAKQLKAWIKMKKGNGRIDSPPDNATWGFTREDQTKKLAGFLEFIIRESNNKL